MDCKNCKNEIPEGSEICNDCGASVTEEAAIEISDADYSDVAAPNEKDALSKKILTLGMVSLFVGILGNAILPLLASVAGIVLAIVALVFVKKYKKNHGKLDYDANLGRGLAIAGLIVSIVLGLIFLALIVLFIIVVAMQVLLVVISFVLALVGALFSSIIVPVISLVVSVIAIAFEIFFAELLNYLLIGNA